MAASEWSRMEEVVEEEWAKLTGQLPQDDGTLVREG
jgi:hypothetical protein